VATALVKGNEVLDDFNASSLKDPKILEITQKVEPRFDLRLNVVRELPPGMVEIMTKQGRTFLIPPPIRKGASLQHVGKRIG